MKTFSLVIIVLLVITSCSKSEPSPKAVGNAERPECASAADCVITANTSCCSCCPATPRAMLKSELQRHEQQCAVVECAACKTDLECPKNEPAAAFVAICKAGACVSEKKK